jgi:hypothetical protein
MRRLYIIERTGIPNVTLKVLQRLAKTMLLDKPEDPSNEVVEQAAARLEACVAEVDEALTVRAGEENPEIVASEREFDSSTDGLWVWLRKLLLGWHEALSTPGLDALPDKLKVQCDLPAARARGERARKLHERLFGANGSKFVRGPFVSQAETMATLLRLIEKDDLGEELEDIVGPQLPVMLATCQIHYEAMVADRMRREGGSSANLREMLDKLRWTIDHYRNAVETLRDPEQPETYALVDKALRSLTLLSERMARAAPGTPDELLGEGLVELDELAGDEPEGEGEDDELVEA